MKNIRAYTENKPGMHINSVMRPVAFFIFISLNIISSARADDAIQFNLDVLDVKDRTHIDLSQFSRAGYVMPGIYQFSIKMNKAELPDQSVEFIAPEDDPKGSSVCLIPDQVEQFGLTSDARKLLTWWHDGNCLNLDSLSGFSVRPDLSTGTLYVNIPQAYLEYTDTNWDPPSRWDDGIAGGIFDYNLNAMSSRQQHAESTQNVSGNGVAGVNIGPWRLRADWQAQYNRQSGNTQQDWDWSRYYAYRAITSLRAKLMLGENYLDSSIFDSFRFAGVSLTTDDNQLPPNLRGYAPEVTGVANTNAKVTVSQQGRVIYETTVAAGPFRIQDLNSAVAGKLDVKVEEQDGSIRTFQVDTANIPYLTRPGLVRYKASIGKPSDYSHNTEGPEFATGEFSWGINNGWSLYGGAILAGDYNSLALGIGRDLLSLGALSFDATQSRAKIPGQEVQSGGSYRLSYSKRFEDYDSQITFAGYRFSERSFMSMSQYLNTRYHSSTDNGNGKELYTVTLNKQFDALNLNAYVNYSHQTYWDRSASDTWNLSLSNNFDIGSFKNVSLSVTAYRSQFDGRRDDGVYLGISLPWGKTGTMSYNGQFGDKNSSSHTVGYYDRIDDNNYYSINAGTTSDGRGTGNGYITHNGDLAGVTANASFRGNEYNAVGFSMQGGLTATSQGAALHRINSVGGTRMMVDSGGVSDVPIRGYGGLAHTNIFGKAVVSDVSSYYRSNVSVDLERLPDDMDAPRSVVQGTLTEGAIGYRKFSILAGKKAMAIIRFANGAFPPFGAEVRNKNNVQTGIVGDDGSVWLSGLLPGELMSVSWNGKKQCRVSLPSPLPEQNNMLLPCDKLSSDR